MVNAKIEDSSAIKRRLLKEMKDGIYSTSKRLPRETVLAAQFGISRTHLRDILAQLEREGFITRRHGVGTVINHHVLNVRNRMDIETEFLDIIRQSGYEPGVSDIRVYEEQADSYVAGKLQIPVGTEVLRICRTCTADGIPAIYCEDVLEKRLMTGEYAAADLEEPIFHFLKKYCDVTAYMDLTQLHAVLASEHVAAALQIPAGTPLLNMEEVDYDIDGTIVFYSSEYFVDQVFEQTVLRKKL